MFEVSHDTGFFKEIENTNSKNLPKNPEIGSSRCFWVGHLETQGWRGQLGLLQRQQKPVAERRVLIKSNCPIDRLRSHRRLW